MSLYAFLFRPPTNREWFLGYGSAVVVGFATLWLTSSPGLGFSAGALVVVVAFTAIWVRVSRDEPRPVAAEPARRPRRSDFWRRRSSLIESVVVLGVVLGTIWAADQLDLGALAIGAAVLAVGLLAVGFFTVLEQRRPR